MTGSRHAAYLHALGVDVYVRRDMTIAEDLDVDVTTSSLMGGGRVQEPLAETVRRRAKGPDHLASASRDPVSGQALAAADCAALGWEDLRAAVAACQRCELHATRTQTVFGVGNREARWMFIGEAPGQEEDRQGEPFVGRAGQLLNAMIRALGMRREDVFIANVLKCRPPGNRDPRPAEAASCRAFLERQVALIDPTLVIAVGRIAAQNLLATETPIAKLRSKVHAFGAKGWPLIVTYHPAYLLRSPAEKRKAWADLLHARQLYTRLEGDRVASRRAS
jgi:DNA polymerase